MFPIDWIITENILNIGKANLELETKIKLKEAYFRILKDERKSRE